VVVVCEEEQSWRRRAQARAVVVGAMSDGQFCGW
jgi:hypothetical protein